MTAGQFPPRVAIALLSGGLDSVVAAAAWMAGGNHLARCLTFDYGQRASAREAEVAQQFCARHSLSWERLALPWLASASHLVGSALVDVGKAMPSGTLADPGDARTAAAVWVPARNCVFLAIGAAFAEALGATVVIAGFNREEAATFPDNSEAFVAAAGEFLTQGTRTGVSVAGPVQHLDKRGIVAAARQLGIARSDLWFCYEGGAEPCGRCESCLRSERAWSPA